MRFHVVLLTVAAAVAVGGTAVYATRATWLRGLASTLVCERQDDASDVVLIDNVGPYYALFARARDLEASTRTGAVIVPVLRNPWRVEPDAVADAFVEVQCRIAGLAHCETFDVDVQEPISLHVAAAAAANLRARSVQSVLLVTPGFRSMRSLEVYRSELSAHGISVHCQPVFTGLDARNWSTSTHGLQDVVLQWLKLWYYRLWVLPD